MLFRSWAAYKREVNSAKTWIKVKLDNLSMLAYPGAGEMVEVTFDQNYASSNLSGQMKRRQYWQKEAGGWKIIYEGALGAS